MMTVRSPTAQGQIDYDTNNRQNVMAATYPELFAAGIAYAGVAAGCFMSDTNQVQARNSTCSQGKSITTPEIWDRRRKGHVPGI
jgi:acetylxylan esterase